MKNGYYDEEAALEIASTSFQLSPSANNQRLKPRISEEEEGSTSSEEDCDDEDEKEEHLGALRKGKTSAEKPKLTAQTDKEEEEEKKESIDEEERTKGVGLAASMTVTESTSMESSGKKKKGGGGSGWDPRKSNPNYKDIKFSVQTVNKDGKAICAEVQFMLDSMWKFKEGENISPS